MAFFNFNNSDFLGNVISVDTRKIKINVEPGKIRLAKVGGLVATKISTSSRHQWLIAIVINVTRNLIGGNDESILGVEEVLLDREVNIIGAVLIGTVIEGKGAKNKSFERSIFNFPDIEGECYALKKTNLEKFMGIISEESYGMHALDVGYYTVDPRARAYIDGNRLFQRHAALLGSTGSGKSWTVATILERAKELPSANIIVFDFHGEFKKVKYAKQLRVAGPDDLNKDDPSLLFLPYWLLNVEDIQSIFIDRSEFSSHNQVMVFQEEVTEAKKEVLLKEGKAEVLKSLTIDSPVPFSLKKVISRIAELNEEMVQGVRGLKMGKFYGQFSRLLVRINSKINDKRYGFLFQAPEHLHHYEAFHHIAEMLIGYTKKGKQKKHIKILDFSEVPADILPGIVGLVARLVFQLQFWMEKDKRQPIALVCDEAHLYIPQKKGTTSLATGTLENFERIAKEGRKYGIGLLVVSQRPSDVSETILSQCNNFIVLRLINYKDQSVVKKLLPESMEGFTDILPILGTGEALIVGDAVLLPTLVKLSPPEKNNRPLSTTVNFWDEWSKADKESDIAQAAENMRKQSRR